MEYKIERADGSLIHSLDCGSVQYVLEDALQRKMGS